MYCYIQIIWQRPFWFLLGTSLVYRFHSLVLYFLWLSIHLCLSSKHLIEENIFFFLQKCSSMWKMVPLLYEYYYPLVHRSLHHCFPLSYPLKFLLTFHKRIYSFSLDPLLCLTLVRLIELQTSAFLPIYSLHYCNIPSKPVIGVLIGKTEIVNSTLWK